MHKLAFKYKTINNTLQGYAEITPPNEFEILDFICKQGIQDHIYSHSIRTEYENVSETNFEYFTYGRSATKDKYDYKIPYCDLVYYVDVYVQYYE